MKPVRPCDVPSFFLIYVIPREVLFVQSQWTIKNSVYTWQACGEKKELLTASL